MEESILVISHAASYLELCVVLGGGHDCTKTQVPPLQLIPGQRSFQIFGVNMELPVTKNENRYIIVFQDFQTKWPLVFPTPDEKAIRIDRLVGEEVLLLFGISEILLSDHGTNLLANVMKGHLRFARDQKVKCYSLSS
uniref:Integrase catalytic domain-containing protein n=1 Tax=Amphimedon queenslandica TaxID=400682 RepID=A0A1X7V8Q9_AMPQE